MQRMCCVKTYAQREERKKDYVCKCNCGRDGTREEGFGS